MLAKDGQFTLAKSGQSHWLLQNDLMYRVITAHDYQDMKGRVYKDIVLVKDKLTELQQEVSPFKVYIQKEVPILENLL